MIKFDYSKTKAGDFSEVKTVLEQLQTNNAKPNDLLYAVDAACTNEAFLAEFQEAFSKDWGKKINFSVLSEDIMKKQFDIQQGNITPTIATSVLPTMEALVRSHELLARINIVKMAGSNEFKQMWDLDAEQNAAILTEVAPGTDVDEVLRTGDVLIPNQKVQASMKISEFTLKTLSASDLGIFFSRLTKRVQNQLCSAILSHGAGVPNGTARGSNIRGILNNYGVNGTGDTTSTIGAISYSTKALTDAAIVAAGGANSTDAYDLVVKAKAFLLPTNIQDVEEEEYIFVGNRNSWAVISTTPDLNGRYKARNAFDTAAAKAKKTIDETEFLVVPSSQCPTSRVYLFPPKFYTLVMQGDLISLSDEGKVQVKEGLIQLVSRAWVSGSMSYGQKFRPTTAVTIGTTAPDNNEQNAFRVFNLV